MYTLLILIAICIIIIYILKLYEDDFLGNFLLFFIGLVISGFITLMASIFYMPELEYKKQWETELISLKDVTSIEGNFYLGSGNIRSGSDYVFFYKNGKYIEKSSIDSYLSKLVLDTNEPPKIICYRQKPVKRTRWLFYMNKCKEETYYEIYLPSNSIYKGFEIDME